MPKPLPSHAAFSQHLSAQLIRMMQQAVHEGMADNAGNEENARLQFYLAWMSAHFAAAVNAAANFDGSRSPETMQTCMSEIGELVARHYPGIPRPDFVAVCTARPSN